MPKTRPAYPPEYRDQIIALARSGRGPKDLAAEFELSAQTIRTWIKQAQVDSGQVEGTTSDDKAELARLRRENAQLREEREILCKATAFFVRETSR
ncbi:transposase [Nocardiopsis sp. LOL_012]|uniref:transposase n=1 Tax=Nocardiopsis sp. LOL_012 TaxID=3345409 RepID=UPI003A860A3B